ncbi:MAG TPA: hypothetical protein VFW29_09365 [Solirubrobacteraceae bacterium]|nr:hypothetical protein [Solirubrobacteraceae bacterium]
MRTRVLGTLAALLTALALFGAASAQAWTLWANHVGIGSGENKFGPFVSLSASLVEPLGSGIICAGIRGVGLMCPGKAEKVVFNAGSVVSSEPYAHNHSTFTSGFNGFYQ